MLLISKQFVRATVDTSLLLVCKINTEKTGADSSPLHFSWYNEVMHEGIRKTNLVQ